MEKVGEHTLGSKLILVAVTLLDVFLANAVYALVVSSGLQGIPPYFVFHQVEGLLCVTVAAMCSVMLYNSIIHRRRVSVLEVFMRVLRMVVVQAIILMIVLRLLLGHSDGVLHMMLYYVAVYFPVLLFSRFMERSALNYIRSIGHNSRAVVFVGSDPANLRIYRELVSSPSVGYIVRGYYSNNKIENAPKEFKCLGTRDELMEIIRAGKIPFCADVVFTSLSTTYDSKDIDTIIHYCDQHVVQFYLVPRIYANLSMNLSPMTVGDFTVFTNHTNNINRLDNRIVKRLFDVIVSALVCVCMLPFVPLIWLIVKMQSPGPLIFSQERTGLNGETFVCYKFRSMHVNKDADTVQATKNDPRKFPFGEFMRKTNIDELPQFFNVLMGDMSIVGPRPHMLYHTEVYSNVISKYMVRHFSKPGITGWAQVAGYRGETKEVWQMEERIKRDIWYNENWSFMLDLEIICRTALQVIHPDKNAY